MSGLEQDLWHVPLAEPVQPRLLDALTGLDEKLLCGYRTAPTCTLIGRRIAPQVAAMLRGEVTYVAVHQTVRMAGIALWEAEHGRVADSIGI